MIITLKIITLRFQIVRHMSVKGFLLRVFLLPALGFQNGGYSVDTTRYVGGTAEQMVENFGEMLRQLYGTP